MNELKSEITRIEKTIAEAKLPYLAVLLVAALPARVVFCSSPKLFGTPGTAGGFHIQSKQPYRLT